MVEDAVKKKELLTVEQAAELAKIGVSGMRKLFRDWRYSQGTRGIRNAYAGRRFVTTADDVLAWYRKIGKGRLG